MANQDIITSLLDWNPWIEGPFPQELLGKERDYHILSYLDVPEIKILEGVRRSGKSTLMYQVLAKVLQKNAQVLYINFEDELLKHYSLAEIVATYQERAPIQCLFIDEIQLCKDWVSYIRKTYDRKEMKQIWISGSNSSLIQREYATLLTGRNFAIDIYPLSFKEYLHFHDHTTEPLPFSTTKEIDIKKHFHAYLEWGGFPAVALRNIYQKELLGNYFDDFIYKDIASRYEVNLIKLKELGLYLASNSAKIFSYRNIGNTLRLHPNTVTDYVSYFKEIFLFKELHKFDFSLKSQLGHDKKIYMMDTGLAASVSFRFSSDKGRMLENLVFIELIRRKQEIYFHKKKKECDFIIKQEFEIIQAIQVTLTLQDPDTKQREMAGLLEAMTVSGLKEGWILTDNEEGEETIIEDGITYQIIILPVWKWLLDSVKSQPSQNHL
jgi:predicted AAA+ superfamily ATPase